MFGGAYDLTVIIIAKEHSDPSSNPRPDSLLFI